METTFIIYKDIISSNGTKKEDQVTLDRSTEFVLNVLSIGIYW